MLPRLLAFFVPAALITVALGAGGFFEPGEAWVQPPPSVAMTRLQERLEHDPKVLVLGNSQAMSSVDIDALGQALGAGASITPAGIPAAQAPTLYAALKHTVFEAGHRPKLVLLTVSPSHLLETAAPEGERLTTLMEHLPAPDPVLDAKVFGKSGRMPGLDRVIARASTHRDAALTWWTSRLAGWFSEAPSDEAMATARRTVLGEVGGANMAMTAQVMPMVQAGPRQAAVVTDLDSTLLPDFVDLCAEHGARLVVVTVPQKMASLATPPALTHRLALWLRDHGAGFLHLEGAPVPSDSWLDEGHMNGRGRDAFTASLVAAVSPLHLLDPGPMAPMPIPVAPPTVRRSAPAKTLKLTELTPTDNPCLVHLKVTAPKVLADAFLSSHGFGYASPLQLSFRGAPIPAHAVVKDDTPCVGAMQHGADKLLVALPPGVQAPALEDFVVSWSPEAPHWRRLTPDAEPTQDAWWVPSEGSLDLSWTELPELTPTTRVQLLIEETREPETPPTVSWSGQPVPLVRWGHLWTAEFPAGEVQTPLTLSIQAPTTSDLFVRDLFFQRDDGAPSVVIGRLADRPDQQPVSGGADVRAAPEWVPRTLSAPQPATSDSLQFTVPAPHTVLTEANLRAAVDDTRFVNCTPLEAHRGTDPAGPPQDPRPQDARPISQREAGVGTVKVEADGAPWTLALRDRRMCFGHVWIQPGEVVTFTPRVQKALAVDADLLHLVAYPFLSGAPATARLLVADQPVATWELRKPGAQDLPLLTPVPAWPESVKLEVTAPADGWIAMGASWLGAATPPPEAWFTRVVAAPEPAPKADVKPAPKAPRPAPKPTGSLPQSLDSVIAAHGADGLLTLPPGATTATPQSQGGVQIQAAAGTSPMVCLPIVPLTSSGLKVALTARLATPGTPVFLDVRWLDAAGRILKTAASKPVITTLRRADVGTAPTALTLDAHPSEGAPAQAQVCVRRGDSGATLDVSRWTVGPAP